MPQMLWFFIAFVIVLALIGLATWLVRRFAGSSLGSGSSRGRLPRLAVIDAAAVDGRRRLVLVRRDNVEHLLMIGGPTDIVVEPNIVRNMPQRDQIQRGPAGTELPPRLAPDDGWSDAEGPHIDPFEHQEPAAPELPRPSRGPYADDGRRSPPSLPIRPGADSIANFTPEPLARPQPPARPEPPRAIPRSERAEPLPPRMPRPGDVAPKTPPSAAPPLTVPPRAPARPATVEPSLSSADQNLADMAQRLEAALRRPGGEPRTDAGESRAPSIGGVERPGAPPVVPEAPSRPAPRAATPPAPPPLPPAETTAFENLEDEMANLLGRPKPPA